MRHDEEWLAVELLFAAVEMLAAAEWFAAAQV